MSAHSHAPAVESYLGIETKVLLCTPNRVDVAAALRVIGDILGTDNCSQVCSWQTEDRSWAQFRRMIGRPLPRDRVDIALGRSHDTEHGTEFAGVRGFDEVIQLLRASSRVDAFFEIDAWQALGESIKQCVPAELRGAYLPDSIGFGAGPKDVFDTNAGRYGRYIMRSQFELTFFGHSSPDGGDVFLDRFLEVPLVQRLRRSVEAVVGKLTPLLDVNA